MYHDRIRKILNKRERKLFEKLDSPSKIQNFLEGLPTNYEWFGDTNYSPRMVLKEGLAHCFEGAVFAAAVLAYHGRRPLLMDFATTHGDEDHTVALFRDNGRWGAISKTNHNVLRYRDPVYMSSRELAMSYFHEYYMYDGRKSMRGFSRPYDLSRFPFEDWITTEDSLDWLMQKLAQTRYYYLISHSMAHKLRKATKIELKALKMLEWTKTGRKNKL